MNTEEILDVVDENDHVVGSMPRKEMYAQGLRKFRVVHAFVRNKAGFVWIPVRSQHVSYRPGAYDFSVSGHVVSGESYDQAIIRETAEELRIDLEQYPWRQLRYFTPQGDGVSLFKTVYEIVCDDEIEFNEEIASGQWLALSHVAELIRANVFMNKDFDIIFKACYGEVGGVTMAEPTRFGDWEKKGRCSDF